MISRYPRPKISRVKSRPTGGGETRVQNLYGLSANWVVTLLMGLITTILSAFVTHMYLEVGDHDRIITKADEEINETIKHVSHIDEEIADLVKRSEENALDVSALRGD